MTTYVIGDVQGCYTALLRLLERIEFDPDKDKLWFAGDLVNRGPDSLNTLRLVRQVASKVVLGNHDLHLLACYFLSKRRGESVKRAKDTFGDILSAPDGEELIDWLRQQPLMVWSKKKNVAMTHAGVPHIWSVKEAYRLSKEVNKCLRSDRATDYFEHMYGNQPETWDDESEGMTRLRLITNYFTRMRFIDKKGGLEFDAKESVQSAPKGYKPWFDHKRPDPEIALIFGHWAALGGVTGQSNIYATDTGCVWGGSLSALNLRTREFVSCDCRHLVGK